MEARAKKYAVDEMMCMSFNRSGETVKIRNKPFKTGYYPFLIGLLRILYYKFRAICDRGSVLYFLPQSTAHR